MSSSRSQADDEDMKDSLAGRFSLVVLALCWIFAALMSAAFVLLLSQPIFIPECASYAPDGQRAAQVVGVAMVVALCGTWALAAVGLHNARGRTLARLALALALPAAVFGVFVAGGAVMTMAIDAVADSNDHAMCW